MKDEASHLLPHPDPSTSTANGRLRTSLDLLHRILVGVRDPNSCWVEGLLLKLKSSVGLGSDVKKLLVSFAKFLVLPP